MYNCRTILIILYISALDSITKQISFQRIINQEIYSNRTQCAADTAAMVIDTNITLLKALKLVIFW